MPVSTIDDLQPKIVLGVAAHPDDLDFGASGSFAKWAAQGAEVYYLIITDGSKGSDDPTITSEKLVSVREQEQKAAAMVVGAKDAFFLKYPDAYLEVTMDLKRDITRYIRKLKPDVVVTTDPTVLYRLDWGFINHSDHRAAGQATIDSVFPMARDRLTFPELASEGLNPHKVTTLLLTSFEKGNYYVDITEHIDQKMKALAAHASQMSDMETTEARVREMSKKIGGNMGVNYGESFIRLKMPG